MLHDMNYFKGKDLELIESLVYNPHSKPSYDFMKDCLIWEDERPEGLSPRGYENLCDLWIVRSYIHQGLPPSKWGLDPKYFQSLWSRAIKQDFRWSGFLRLKLSKSDREYYDKERLKSLTMTEI